MSAEAFNQIVNHFGTLTPQEQERLIHTLTDVMARRGALAQRRSILEIRGLGKDVWPGMDAAEYVRQERASWRGKAVDFRRGVSPLQG